MPSYGSLADIRATEEKSENQCFLIKLEDSARVNGAGSAGSYFVTEAQKFIMIEEPEKARQLLTRANEFIEYSIAHDDYLKVRPHERMPEYYQARFYDGLALSNWLLTDVHDQENNLNAGKFLAGAIEKKQYRRVEKSDVSEMLLCFLQTGDYAFYFKCHNRLKYQVPSVLSRATSCSSLAYLLCEHWSEGKHGRDALVAQIRKYLKRLVPTDSPYFNLVTLWVKLLHWHLLEERDKTAFELLGQYRQYLRPE